MAKPKKPKFYVVWQGHEPGVYKTWAECQSQINGYSGAKYKSFPTLSAAEKAFTEDADAHYGKSDGSKKKNSPTEFYPCRAKRDGSRPQRDRGRCGVQR